jgi:cobalt-zinc-cadmium efflux system outer membrane protein
VRPHVVAALAAFAVGIRAQAEEASCPAVADLPALLRCARALNDSVIRAGSALGAARARKEVASRVLPSNPALEVGAGKRTAQGGASEIDRSLELAQTFEIGGQRGSRVAAADASIRAAAAAADASVRDLQLDVIAAAAEVVRARVVLAIARGDHASAERLRDVSRARAGKGVAAPMEAELAEAARIQALRDEGAAAASSARGESDLAALVGADVRLTEGAALPAALSASQPLNRYEDAALARPEVIAAREEATVAKAEVELLQRQRIPDVTVAAGYRYEEFSTVLGARLSIPLPVFNRNGPEIAEQRERVRQAESAARQAELRARLAVRSAYAAWQRSRDAADAVSQDLEDRLREDALALQTAYERGTMPLAQVLASLRETRVARRTLVETRADVVRATLELHRAAGLSVCDGGGCQ